MGIVFGTNDCKSFVLMQETILTFRKSGIGFSEHVTFNTVANPNGAYFQIGEIEYFGDDKLPVDPNGKLATQWGSIKKVR